MGAGAGGATEQHGVVALQPLGHVVGVQDGQLGGLRGGGTVQWAVGEQLLFADQLGWAEQCSSIRNQHS